MSSAVKVILKEKEKGKKRKSVAPGLELPVAGAASALC